MCIYRHRCVRNSITSCFLLPCSQGGAHLHHGQLALGAYVAFPELWEGLTSQATWYVSLNRHFGQISLFFPDLGWLIALLREIKRSRRANIFV